MTPKRRTLMAPRQQCLDSRSVDIEIDVRTKLSLVPKQDAWSSASDNPDIESRSGNWAERSRSGRN